MTKFIARSVIIVLMLFLVVVVGWALTYPSESDPKSIKYVLWKNGLYGMNLETATDTMIGDRSREKLVVGKTRVQLREKFGYLSKASEISPYLRGCYQDSAWKDKDVLFIRQTPWMVIFDGDKATELILFKGC
jgi:hypothetical protein